MDNAAYHSVINANNRAPTSSSKKGDIIEWLEITGIPFDKNMLKPELYLIVKQHKPPPNYRIDCLIMENGHRVLRLPPYHCDLNPIELIWSQVKCTVAQRNKDFSLRSTLALTEAALAEITDTDWRKACAHVQHIIEDYVKNDGIRGRHPTVCIEIDESSSGSSSSSDES